MKYRNTCCCDISAEIFNTTSSTHTTYVTLRHLSACASPHHVKRCHIYGWHGFLDIVCHLGFSRPSCETMMHKSLSSQSCSTAPGHFIFFFHSFIVSVILWKHTRVDHYTKTETRNRYGCNLLSNTPLRLTVSADGRLLWNDTHLHKIRKGSLLDDVPLNILSFQQ